ncbi:MAG: PIN domain-containing protein [Terriglobia bacterium]
MVEEVLLDTNVILRHALADDPAHQQQARRLFEQAGEGKLRLLVPSLVIAQVVWTLESFYRASREYIAGLLRALLATPGVTAIEPRVASRCIEIYRAHNLEIVDAYLVALAEETKTSVLATFNKRDLRRFPHLKLIP